MCSVSVITEGCGAYFQDGCRIKLVVSFIWKHNLSIFFVRGKLCSFLFILMNKS